MHSTRLYAQYLWLAPVGALLVLAAVLAHHPREAHYRQGVVTLFEQAERVEFYVWGDNEPAVVVPRGDTRKFRAILHGVRDSWVTAHCPAEPDIQVDLYLTPSPPERPEPELVHASYHTTCRQLTVADTRLQLSDRTLHLGAAFRALVPQPRTPSACPQEFLPE